jgi:hypothetical protein
MPLLPLNDRQSRIETFPRTKLRLVAGLTTITSLRDVHSRHDAADSANDVPYVLSSYLALQNFLLPESGVKTLVLGLKSFEPPDFVEDVVNQML